jgi:hypothetical protein
MPAPKLFSKLRRPENAADDEIYLSDAYPFSNSLDGKLVVFNKSREKSYSVFDSHEEGMPYHMPVQMDTFTSQTGFIRN